MKRAFFKILIFIILIPIAAIVGAIYGALHDQISYAVSTEYFLNFKFIQFNIDGGENAPRLGAAIVGALGTWWMGALIGIILGFLGFLFPTPKQMFFETLFSFSIVIIIAFIIGIGGLTYGYYTTWDGNIFGYEHWIDNTIKNPAEFVRVGIMHNASYFGGVIGLLIGIGLLIYRRFKI